MAKIVRFEDVVAWQKARVLAKRIYEMTDRGQFGKDRALREQIRRAAISIMSNIAEGFARRSSKEFAHFLNIARGSAAELQAQLYLAADFQYLSQEEFTELYGLSEEISRMSHGFMGYLRANSQLSTRNSQLKGVVS